MSFLLSVDILVLGLLHLLLRYSKTYNKTFPPLDVDAIDDTQDSPPRKYLPRTYSTTSNISSGFSSDLHIPGVDPGYGHTAETEVTSFRVRLAEVMMNEMYTYSVYFNENQCSSTLKSGSFQLDCYQSSPVFC